ncbi:MAG: hypothetical protein ABII01_06450 [Candidatus Woesearchaeota archaeon]
MRIRSKKAWFGFQAPFAVMWTFFVLLVVMTIIGMISFMVVTRIDIKDVETDVMAYRFLYSPNGFTYKNEMIQRNYPGFVDMEKFNEDTLDKMLSYKNNEILTAKLTLKNLEDGKENIIYFNKEWFDRYYPLALTKIPGPGGATISTKSFPVIIVDSIFEDQKQGTLKIDVVMPNS